MQINGVGTLTIQELTPEDEGNYSCTVANPFGTDSISYQLKVQVPPPPPTLKILETFYDAIHIAWLTLSDGGSRLKGRQSYTNINSSL
jgi:hypothetical protein